MFETENDLIDGMIRGEDAAFRQAIKSYQSSMRYLAASMTGDKIADEVVQEAWFSALKAIAKFEKRSSLKTWLLRIVANEAKTRLRKENRLTSLDAMTAEDPDLLSRFDDTGHWTTRPSDWGAEAPEDLLTQEELRTCIDELINVLPDMQGATLNLRERQGYSLADICNILDVSESNVRVLLHRARVRLYRCVELFQQTGECCTT